MPHYSSKILKLASVLLLTLVPCAAALAAGEYTVENVMVDADGKDTSDARNKALAKGEKDAFSQLIIRLNPAGAAQIFKQVSPKQVSTSVHSFAVKDEKMTSTHYHATLSYTFDSSQIQALSSTSPPTPASPAFLPAVPSAVAAPVPASTTPPTTPAAPERVRKAALVLPVYNEGGALELWQDENKWRNVWYDAALESGSGLVVVPLGNINDRVDVDDSNVSAATPNSLKRMYDRYGVGEIIVAQAFFNEKADPKPTLEVTLKRLSPTKPEITQVNYTIHSTESLDGLLVRASNDIARSLYKRQTIDPNKIEYDRVKEINARINTNSIQEWQALRSRLLMRSNIVDVKFVSISYYETSMVITYKGTADILGKTLVASGLRVLQDGDSLVLSVK